MKVIEPGHIYALTNLDAPPDAERQLLVFVNRDGTGGGTHGGTQSQEVLRACVQYVEDCMNILIDRTNHCDACLPWNRNGEIIKAMSEAQRQMRLALVYHEQRVFERRMDKEGFKPEKVPVGDDGHWTEVKESLDKVENGIQDLCVATGINHEYGHFGRNGEVQCRYCGSLRE